MAEIIDSSSSNNNGWIGLIKWADGINDNVVEPTASSVAWALKRKNYEVNYFHAPKVDDERKTWFTIKRPEGRVGIPEGPSQDWDEAVGRTPGATSEFFEYNHDVTTFVQNQI